MDIQPAHYLVQPNLQAILQQGNRENVPASAAALQDTAWSGALV
jgi:hypothetical protein